MDLRRPNGMCWTIPSELEALNKMIRKAIFIVTSSGLTHSGLKKLLNKTGDRMSLPGDLKGP